MNHPYQTQAIEPAESDYQRIAALLDLRPTAAELVPMLSFAETCKVTAGPKKGEIISLKNAPYARRPLELMDPGNVCQLLILMFSSQSMKSVIAQIVTAYYSKILPSEIIYAMSNLNQVRKVMNRRLTPLLEALGVQFVTQTVTKSSRKTGDTTFSKEFPGGNLDGVTQGSSADLAAETKRLGIADELGDWKVQISNQGNPFYQLWARLKAWLDEKKCLVPSTPGDEGSCMVEHLFLTGTQEEWWVPCPKCGDMQVLEVQNREGFGLDWRTKRGKIIESSIVYVCRSCAKSFKEKYKYGIQQSGEWRQPKGAEPIDQYTASFHIHSINSMFESWREVARAYEKGRDDPIAKKYYDNHVAGQPHKQSGTKIKGEDVAKNRGEYPRQTVPDGVLYLTLGSDIQRGRDRWQDLSEAELQQEIKKAIKEGDIHEKKFPRIELEVYGPGPAYRGWSIDYQVFYGHVKDAYAGAFEQFFQWAVGVKEKNGGFGFKRDDGKFFPVVMALIDSGHEASTVYAFTQRLNYTYPSKGESVITPSKIKAAQDQHQSNFIFWKQSKVGQGTILYRISTKLYKKALYGFLGRERIIDEIQNPGFQDFPREYGSRYFDMLTAEERLSNGEYDPKGRPNEALDCRVYAMCASDIYLNSQVEMFRASYKKEGWSDKRLEQLNSRWAIEYFAAQAGIDKRYLETKSK